MNEKRFEFRLCSDELYYFYIIDNENGKEYRYLIDDEFLKLLNELHEEKEQLKSRINDYDVALKTLQDLTERKLKENEQLKEENNELKQFKQMVFDLIDKKINEKEKKYKFGQEVYRGCPMHNIRYGINTLKELREDLSE